MSRVSCVSCAAWMYWVNAAESHEIFHEESGMRLHHSSPGPLSRVRRLTVCGRASLKAAVRVIVRQSAHGDQPRHQSKAVAAGARGGR